MSTLCMGTTARGAPCRRRTRSNAGYCPSHTAQARQAPGAPFPGAAATVTAEELQGVLRKHAAWVASRGGEGARANLAGRDLRNADLEGAMLSRADLRGSDLRNVSLRGANLRCSRLEGACVSGADLFGADLRRTDLSRVTGLRAGQLGGALLDESALPQDAPAFDALEHAREISQHARTMFLATVGACIYCWLTIATTSDASLLTRTGETALPIIQTEVPLAGFYLVAPLLLFGLFLYLHLYLQRLWEALARLPATFPDGARLNEKCFPWLLLGLASMQGQKASRSNPSYSRSQFAASLVAAWMLVPGTVFLFWVRYLPLHDMNASLFHGALFGLSTALAVVFFSNARATLRGRLRATGSPRHRLPVSGTCAAVLLGGASMGVLYAVCDGAINGAPVEHNDGVVGLRRHVPEVMSGLGFRPFLDVEAQEISRRPATWTTDAHPEQRPAQFDAVRGALLSGASLRHARARGAFLVSADLRRSDLRYADLRQADLSEADLFHAQLPRACISGARLWRASLSGANLEEVNQGCPGVETGEALVTDLSFADLSWARVREGLLDRASLQGTSLVGADFRDVSLTNADLSTAQAGCGLRGGARRCSDFSGARLNGSDMQGGRFSAAIFQHADLEGVDLNDAVLIGANFRGASMSSAKLARARANGVNLEQADLQMANLDEINLDDADLRNVRLTGASLRDATLRRADIGGASMGKTDLRDAELELADLREANLFQADLRGASMPGARLSGARLVSAEMEDADLREAHLDGANLEGANLRGADLRGVRLGFFLLRGRSGSSSETDRVVDRISGTTFERAILAGADLRYVDFVGVDLRNADLQGAKLSDPADSFFGPLKSKVLALMCARHHGCAEISGADLRGVEGLTEAWLSAACGNGATRLPEGFSVQPCRPSFDSESRPGHSGVR